MPTGQRFARLLLAGVVTSACGQATSPSSSSSPVGAGFLYVPAAGAVHAFAVERETGALSPLAGSPFAAGAFVEAGPLTFVPATRMLFGGGQQVPFYRADLRTGALTLLGHVPGPGVLALDATGRHLYAVGGSFIGPGGIDFIPYPGKTWAYAVDPPTGRLSELSGSPYDGGYYPQAAAVVQGGRLVLVCNQGYFGHYVTRESISSLSIYARNDTTGVLTAAPGSPFNVGCVSERWLAVTPSGRAIFSAGPSSGRLAGYRLGADGRPVLASQLTYGGPGQVVESLALDPSGQWLFASLGYGQQAILVFAVDDEGGGLVQRQRVALESPAGWVRVDPSGRFLLEWRGGQLHVWAFDRDSGRLQPAANSPLQGDGGPAAVLADQVAFEPSGHRGYAATRRADGSYAILPFVLDAAARSIAPVPEGAGRLPAEPGGLTFVPAEP